MKTQTKPATKPAQTPAQPKPAQTPAQPKPAKGGTLAAFQAAVAQPLKDATAKLSLAQADAKKAEAGYFAVIVAAAHASKYAPTPAQVQAAAKAAGGEVRDNAAGTLASVAGQATRLAVAGFPLPAAVTGAPTQKALREALTKAIKANKLETKRGRKPKPAQLTPATATPAQRRATRAVVTEALASLGTLAVKWGSDPLAEGLGKELAETMKRARELIGAIDEVTAKDAAGK